MTTYSGERNPRWSGKRFCSVCGKELITYQERRRKTCSDACALKGKMHPADQHPRWSGVKKCVICGAELHGAAARKNKTCSDACASKQKSRSKTGEKNNHWKGGKVYCRQCGVEITHAHRLHVKFCSRKCMAKWQSLHLSRENSPLWQGGSAYADYPPDFNAKLRRSIRKRDGYQCQRCFKKQYSLDVHHIDQDKKNSSPENLTSLCRSCHRQVHWELYRVEQAQNCV